MAFVQDNANSRVGSYASTITCAYSSNVTSGNRLSCFVNWQTTSSPPSLTDSQGNTWTQAGSTVSHSANDQYCAWFVSVAGSSGANTVTADYSGTTTSAYSWIYVVESSGRDATAANCRVAGQLQTSPGTGSNAVTSGNLTSVSAGSDLIGISNRTDNYNGFTLTAGTDWTSRDDCTTSHFVGRGESRDNVSSGTYAATFTTNTNAPFITLILELPAGSGSQTLSPSLVTSTQTFYAATVGRGVVSLAPSLVTNSQTFHAATVSGSYELTPGLLTNSQTFYGPTASAGAVALAASLVVNGQTFYAPTVSGSAGAQTLEPSLVTNNQTFYAPTVLQPSNVELIPSLLVNDQTFLPSVVDMPSAQAGGDDAYHHTGWNKKAWKAKKKQEEALEETIRKTYRKVQGVEPTQSVIDEIVEEVKEYAPGVVKPEKFDYSGVMEWLQAQETRVAQIIEEQQEEDDEEALLLLL